MPPCILLSDEVSIIQHLKKAQDNYICPISSLGFIPISLSLPELKHFKEFEWTGRRFSGCEMASKLWAYGKRLTIWGVLVSSLPLLFFPFMFFSVLGIAFSVPLGCSIAIYVCLRKCYYTLFKEEVGVQKGLGLKESEAVGFSDVQESESEEEKSRIQERTIHEDNAKPLGEETEKVKGRGGEPQAELDPYVSSSDEGEQPSENQSLTQAQKSEGEVPLIEKLVPQEEDPEEAQAQHEEAPEDEAQKGEAREAQIKEKWNPDEEADTLQWEVQKEQLDPLEEQDPEVETHKDEAGEAQLRENWDAYEEEEPLDTLQLDAQEQLNPLEEQASEVENHKAEVGEAQLKANGDTHEEEEGGLQGKREAERGEEGQVQLTKKSDTNGGGFPIEKNEAPEDEAHYRVKDEGKVCEGEAQLKWEPQEGKNARQDQVVEVEVQYSPKKEVEVEVNPSEGEAQSDNRHGSAGESIRTKHKRIEEQGENNEKLYATDTKHKIREEEDQKQDEFNGVQEIPHKRSRHEQSLDLVPSTLYTETTSTEANMVTPEATPHSSQSSIQAESPLGASNLGVKNDEPIEDNGATGLPIPPSSEMLVSSASESDKDSKSLSEGAVKEDPEDAEHIWEEIHVLRNIIGYKEDPQHLYAEEIKALYIVTGIEPPASLKCSGDLDRAKEKLKLLKAVYGIK